MIRYYQKKKTKRNNDIYKLHLQGISDAEIGRQKKISRQRVRKIRLAYAKNKPVDKIDLTTGCV